MTVPSTLQEKVEASLSPSGSSKPTAVQVRVSSALAGLGEIVAPARLGRALPMVTLASPAGPSPWPSWAVTATDQTSPRVVESADSRASVLALLGAPKSDQA